MKTWKRKYEWMQLAVCAGSDLHTAETLNAEQLEEATKMCDSCKVRPECMEWALKENACSVFVAGVSLPDPAFKRELRSAYAFLKRSLPKEREARGRDV